MDADLVREMTRGFAILQDKSRAFARSRRQTNKMWLDLVEYQKSLEEIFETARQTLHPEPRRSRNRDFETGRRRHPSQARRDYSTTRHRSTTRGSGTSPRRRSPSANRSPRRRQSSNGTPRRRTTPSPRRRSSPGTSSRRTTTPPRQQCSPVSPDHRTSTPQPKECPDGQKRHKSESPTRPCKRNRRLKSDSLPARSSSSSSSSSSSDDDDEKARNSTSSSSSDDDDKGDKDAEEREDWSAATPITTVTISTDTSVNHTKSPERLPSPIPSPPLAPSPIPPPTAPKPKVQFTRILAPERTPPPRPGPSSLPKPGGSNRRMQKAAAATELVTQALRPTVQIRPTCVRPGPTTQAESTSRASRVLASLRKQEEETKKAEERRRKTALKRQEKQREQERTVLQGRVEEVRIILQDSRTTPEERRGFQEILDGLLRRLA